MRARFFALSIVVSCCSISFAEDLAEIGREVVPIKCVGHTGAVTAVAVSPDGKRAASVSYTDNTLRMWDTGNGDELFRRDLF